MKYSILLGAYLLLNNHIIKACDVCGCALNNGFSTVLPQFQKNFIGLRQGFASFETMHPDEGALYKESVYSADLWARYYVHKRVQFLLSLPYTVKTRNAVQVKGIGDMQLSVNYTLLNRNRDSQQLKQLWIIGARIKLPTGNNAAYSDDVLLPEAMQQGSGSLDYIYSTMYTIRYGRIGLSSDLQYRLNYENRRLYAFGNTLSAGSRLFYWKKLGKNCNVIPSMGVLLENMKQDYLEGYAQEGTGGNIQSAVAGCELYVKRFAFSLSGSFPLAQQMGYVHTQPRFQCTTSFIF